MIEKKRIIIKHDTIEMEDGTKFDTEEEEEISEQIDEFRTSDILMIYTPLITILSLVIYNLYLYNNSIKVYDHPILKKFFHYSKRNFMNILFIKNGLLWVFPLLIANRLISNTRESGFVSRMTKVFSLWYITVVSLFPFSNMQSLSELIFVYTGGKCVFSDENIASSNIQKTRFKIQTLKHCRRLKGQWINGHDLSGHLFFLTLMVWVVGMEVFELSGKLHNKTLRHGEKLKKALKLFSVFLIMIYGYNIMITILNEFHCYTEVITGFLWGYLGGYYIYKDYLYL